MGSRKSKTQKKRERSSPRPVPRSGTSNAPDRMRDTTRSAPEKELAGLKPKPGTNERVEDLAVFSNVGREQLSDDLKLECTAVMESLDAVTAGDFDQANERLKNIARSSPYADWRLFIRGLCGFYQEDFETAKQNWQRLDATRRPARIANVLISAELKQPLAEFVTPPKRLVDAAAMLMHRSNAVAAAKKIMSVKHRDSEVRFSPSQVAMLTNFRDDFRRVDADFVARFSQACVHLACAQSDPNVFMLLKKSVPGPLHDPRWNLQEFLYMRGFEDVEEDRQETAEAYIETDLPAMTQFSKEQKNALASCMWVDLATMLNDEQRGTPFFFLSDPPDFKTIEQLLGKAIKNYRTNREAHKLLLDVLDRQIDSERSLTKAQIEAAEKRLIKAKESYVGAFPGEIETSLELVDHYFSSDELDKADALVMQLSSQRLDSPLAKALPWKLKLLSAMHATRKKAELSAARESLAIADSQWPTWLARTWLPFLKAALELRCGNQEQFESLDKQAREDAGTSQTACEFMTFAAIQQMNVPAAILKPYRDNITKHLNNVEELPLPELISIGAFFWDLSRAGLEHKGFRLQASKVGKAICSRLKKGEKTPFSSQFIEASCFCASRGFWQNSFPFSIPPWAAELSKTEPKVVAAFVGWAMKSSSARYSLDKLKPLADSLQEAAKTEKDPFHRYRFEQLASSTNEAITEFNRGRSSPSMFGWSFDMNNDDDDDNEIDDNCQCAQCKADRAREAAQAKRAKTNEKSAEAKRQPLFDFFDDEVDDEDEDDDEFDMGFGGDSNLELQSAMARAADIIGPERMQHFIESLASAAVSGQSEGPSVQLRNLVEVCYKFGLPIEETSELLQALGQQMNSSPVDSLEFEDQYEDSPTESPTTPQRPMSAEERKAFEKKRRRELEKKKRR